MKKITWLVVANSAKADFYKIENKDYALVETLTHPESRLKSSELTSDEAGSYRSGGAGHGQFEPATNPHEQEHQTFAKEIANFLEKNRTGHHYEALIICAEARFYGLLNKAMTGAVRLLVTKTIEKDYIPLPKIKMQAAIEGIINP